ncbi:hypothetical protein [Prauserella flavalba]|uniref:hypothetical protein n=1 Tax=Prauserella flavalba TaxID=1477506 RepID=UPI0036EE7E0B
MAEEFSAEKGLDDVFARAGSALADVQKVYGTQNWVQTAVDVTAGKWTFDAEQIDAVIGQWEDLLEDLTNDRSAIDAISMQATPPSGDDPSNKFVEGIREGMRSLRESNDSMVAYVDDFLGRLREAKEKIGATENNNASPMQAASGRPE